MAKTIALWMTLVLAPGFAQKISNTRPRASDLGLKVGILPVGPINAITDVAGVEVGQTTIVRGGNIRTGVTAILPHPGNLYREKVPGAIFVGNGFGKLTGSTQVEEKGAIEAPVLLTSTTSVPRVADAPMYSPPSRARKAVPSRKALLERARARWHSVGKVASEPHPAVSHLISADTPSAHWCKRTSEAS